MLPKRALELIDAHDARVEPTWRALEAQTRPPYFLTWGWVENWLASLPADERPPLAVITAGGAPAAAFFLGRRRQRRFMGTSDALYFNATGSPRHDQVYLEHNGLLAAPGADRSLAALLDLLLLQDVLPGEWDELHLPAIDRYAFDDLGAPVAQLAHYRVGIEREAAAPYIDLDAVRGVEGGYVALLGSSTRTQLHRTRRILGDLEVEVAVDVAHALEIFGELLDLQRQRRVTRGEPGTFADPWFDRLHRRLLEQRFAQGEIQLVRVRASGSTIGCLYNLVSNGRVVFYQCGIAPFSDPHIKAGYVVHAAAVEYNALAGHRSYDLLGGDPRYTPNLATGVTRLVWLRVQRPRARFRIEDHVRAWKRALAGIPAWLSPRPA